MTRCGRCDRDYCFVVELYEFLTYLDRLWTLKVAGRCLLIRHFRHFEPYNVISHMLDSFFCKGHVFLECVLTVPIDVTPYFSQLEMAQRLVIFCFVLRFLLAESVSPVEVNVNVKHQQSILDVVWRLLFFTSTMKSAVRGEFVQPFHFFLKDTEK